MSSCYEGIVMSNITGRESIEKELASRPCVAAIRMQLDLLDSCQGDDALIGYTGHVRPAGAGPRGVVVVRTFSAQRLRDDLAALTPWQRAVFAVGCVEVLLPAYVKFNAMEEAGDPDLVREIVDAVWSALESSEVGSAELPAPEVVQVLLPDDEDWNEWAPQAEDAIAALVYLLELLRQDDVDLAAYPAERAYAAVDEFAAREQGLEVLHPADRAALVAAPSIQAELQRQADALAILRDASAGRSVVAQIRAAARRLPIGDDIPA
jgi:uncharacterized protein YjaG (DUF416 family)